MSAVVLDVAGASSTDSRLFVDPSDATRNLGSLSLSGSGWDSTTVIVEPGADGKIKIFNERGTTRVNVDVQGYFTKTSGEATTGGYVPTGPTRVVDSVNGKQLTTALTGSTAKTIQVADTDGIPSNVTAVFAHVRALNASGAGGLRFTAADQSIGQGTPSMLNYEPGRAFDTGGIIAVDAAGKAKIQVSSGTSVDVAIDVHGYFTKGTDGGSFEPMENQRLWDSANTAAGNLAAGEARTIKVGGLLGMPDDARLGSVALSIVARDYTSSGYISVVNADLSGDNGTSNLAYTGTYDATAPTASAIVQTSGDRKITIRNRSSSSVRVALNAQGWFYPRNNLPTISSPTITTGGGQKPRISATLGDADGQTLTPHVVVKDGGTAIVETDLQPTTGGTWSGTLPIALYDGTFTFEVSVSDGIGRRAATTSPTATVTAADQGVERAVSTADESSYVSAATAYGSPSKLIKLAIWNADIRDSLVTQSETTNDEPNFYDSAPNETDGPEAVESDEAPAGSDLQSEEYPGNDVPPDTVSTLSANDGVCGKYGTLYKASVTRKLKNALGQTLVSAKMNKRWCSSWAHKEGNKLVEEVRIDSWYATQPMVTVSTIGSVFGWKRAEVWSDAYYYKYKYATSPRSAHYNHRRQHLQMCPARVSICDNKYISLKIWARINGGYSTN